MLSRINLQYPKFAFLLLLTSLMQMVQACSQQGGKTAEPITVKVVDIRLSDQSHPQVFVGRVEPVKSSLVTSSAPGRLVQLKVRKGQNVKAGDIIAIIDSPTVKSLYESSKASYAQAKDALRRVERVYATGSVSELKLVDVKTSCSKAKAAFSAASRALENCRVKAPYDGVVGDLLAEEGVEMNAAEPIVRILDISSVEVHASVPENEYARYRIGQQAQVRVDAAGCSVDAVLTEKGLEASALSHSYDFTFRMDQQSIGMMPGMVCKVYMTSPGGSSVVIPSSAVRIDSDGRYVWCIGPDGAVCKKHIAVNGFAGDGIVVEYGLSEGDQVVVEGCRKISTGMRNIKIIKSYRSLD